MTAIRTFIAISLPSWLQDKLGEIILLLSGCDEGNVRWVPSKNIHLTLKFLGDISPANLEVLTKILQAELKRHSSFEMCIGSLGAYPSIRRPRVIWVGVKAPASLTTLQSCIEAETRRLGYSAEERPFSPHLTIGRVSHHINNQQVSQVAEALLANKVGELGSVNVESVHLFRSDLQPAGAVYTSLYSGRLGR